jgi:uncharacterized membrane protein YhaH (DUF805 family)
MHFKNAIRLGFQNYANFKGRSTRSEFWFWVLFFWIAVIGASLFDAVFFSGVSSNATSGIGLYLLPLNLVGYALVVPNVSVFVRRLHDTDRKGWWWLLGFVPFGGLVLLSWLCSKGSPNSNRFGGTGSSMEGSM